LITGSNTTQISDRNSLQFFFFKQDKNVSLSNVLEANTAS